MNNNQPYKQDQEIKVSDVSRHVSGVFYRLGRDVFRFCRFLVRNAVIVSVLFVVGAALGIYLDRTSKSYSHVVIVSPNFASTNYLYDKIELIAAKRKEGDTVFLKETVGIPNPKRFYDIEIEPISDVYGFIANKEENFQMLKLMAEAEDIKKILKDELTAKNYPFHRLTFKTDKPITEANTIKPLLDYLNQSDYYRQMQAQSLRNMDERLRQNDSIIGEINDILDAFSKTSAKGGNDKLVYYNENTQLNDIIQTKNYLITQQGYNRLERIKMDKIIKEMSLVLNMREREGLEGKMKFILPIVFVGMFVAIYLFRHFYKRQAAKYQA